MILLVFHILMFESNYICIMVAAFHFFRCVAKKFVLCLLEFRSLLLSASVVKANDN